MPQLTKSFSGFAVKDLAAAKQFYQETLGVTVADNDGMGLILKFDGGNNVFVYEKPDHEPAVFTILNFPVEDLDAAIDELVAKGIEFEKYDNPDLPQDEKGVLRGKDAGMGPNIAWFTDPSGNVLSVLQD